MKGLYKYPQREYPYVKLVTENRERTKQDREFELTDTGKTQRVFLFQDSFMNKYCLIKTAKLFHDTLTSLPDLINYKRGTGTFRSSETCK